MDKTVRNIKVIVSDDEMSCRVCLEMMDDSDSFLYSEVMAALGDKGVTYGIDNDLIYEIIDKRLYNRMHVVANGRPKVDGIDGYYTYTFNTNPSKKPKLLEDGSVDYLNLNLIQCVSEGDLLARYFEKVDGTDGMTVTGKPILATVAKHLAPLRGKGFTISEDCMEYYAALDGKVELQNGSINVSQLSTIPGDVGLKVGNLDVKGDLEIMGNVTAGMIVKATGNISISGLVEAATIEAGKNLLIKGGILGGGKASIKAGGSIFALFIENSLVESGDCIQADSLVNTIARAYNDVNIFGKTSSIVGGSIKANRMVRTKSLGSLAQVLTRITVGVDSSEYKELAHKESVLKEEMDELAKILKAMEMLKEQDPNNTQSEMMLLLIRTKIEKNVKITLLKEEIENIKKRIELAKSAEVVAEEIAHQGTIITIDGYILRLNDDYEKISFVRKNNRVLTRLFDENNYDKIELAPSKLF